MDIFNTHSHLISSSPTSNLNLTNKDSIINNYKSSILNDLEVQTKHSLINNTNENNIFSIDENTKTSFSKISKTQSKNSLKNHTIKRLSINTKNKLKTIDEDEKLNIKNSINSIKSNSEFISKYTADYVDKIKDKVIKNKEDKIINIKKKVDSNKIMIDELFVKLKNKLNPNSDYLNIKNKMKMNTSNETEDKSYKYAEISEFKEHDLLFIQENRSVMKREYAKYNGKTYISDESKNKILKCWINIINKLVKSDLGKTITCMRILGEIYLEFSDIENAKKILFFHKYLSINLEIPNELHDCYEVLGNLYKNTNNYTKSILCFKKQLEIAWLLENYISELRCYDNIGIQNFYIGNKSKCRYYHNRMMNGVIEKKSSNQRQKAIKQLIDKYTRVFTDIDGNLRVNRKYNHNHDVLNEKLNNILNWFDSEKYNKDNYNIELVNLSNKLNDSTISETDVSFLVLNDNIETFETSNKK